MQAEVEAKKGKDFLIRDQLQEAAEAARAKAAAEAASHSPFSKELSGRDKPQVHEFVAGCVTQVDVTQLPAFLV